MLTFYKDAALTLPLGSLSPKRALLPSQGGVKHTSVWLGDGYTATVQTLAPVGSTALTLDQTLEFPNTGTVVFANGMAANYTGKTASSLTGLVTPYDVPAGSKVYPLVTYTAVGSIRVYPIGSALGKGVKIGLKKSTDTDYNFPGTPVTFAAASMPSGAGGALEIDLEITVDSGLDQVFSLEMVSSPMSGVTGQGYLEVTRQDQSLVPYVRVLPLNRQVNATLPGMTVGEQRWRESSNAGTLVPIDWDVDLSKIGSDKFKHGFGHGDDLELVGLEESDNSILPTIKPGAYFAGLERCYLPANAQLEFLSTSNLSYSLLDKPAAQKPIFVGVWHLDSQGFYTILQEYDRVLENPDTNQYQYTLISQSLTLSRGLDSAPTYIGTLGSDPVEFFDIPIYPVSNVTRVYVDRGPGVPALPCQFLFDRAQGTLTVTKPLGANSGEPVSIVYEPAIAVLYEKDGTERQLTVDVNPAFSGVGQGYLYLQHRRQKADSIQLAVDKNRIDTPITFQSVADLTAYGPVYYEGDYALLIATALSKVPGEALPNQRLNVKVGDGFVGLINYQDPRSGIQVITGGDGSANLIYTPQVGYGYWLENSSFGVGTTNIVNDTLLLPGPIDLAQLWNASEGWLVTSYQVFNNSPIYGLLGGDPTKGEVPFVASGIPGTVTYKTNGMRQAWMIHQAVVRPIHVLDSNNKNESDPLFNGQAVKIVYGQALPTDASTAAYFLSFIQRVQIWLEADDSNVTSNSVLLQMQVPPLVLDAGFLVIDGTNVTPVIRDSNGNVITPGVDINGALNQYRLGWPNPLSRPTPNV